MYAIFVRHDRAAPRDVVPTEEEGVQLLGSMAAYAGTYTLGGRKVIHHIDIPWNQSWMGTDQTRFFELEGDTLTITTAPLPELSRRGRRGARSWSGRRSDCGGPGSRPLWAGRIGRGWYLRSRRKPSAGDRRIERVGKHFARVLAEGGARVSLTTRRTEALAAGVAQFAPPTARRPLW